MSDHDRRSVLGFAPKAPGSENSRLGATVPGAEVQDMEEVCSLVSPFFGHHLMSGKVEKERSQTRKFCGFGGCFQVKWLSLGLWSMRSPFTYTLGSFWLFGVLYKAQVAAEFEISLSEALSTKFDLPASPRTLPTQTSPCLP
ncbi:hypothetical protein L596_012345 [Steinernema carpocapsae]|uniref:Uncharacterized protein n=1 Tax=Steinernema carpocapsae TaxID=34508 RepID=A0A4U5NXN3_STECR|nr:hypothetical protein L596_012345 [Steinernema carpocapsae]